MNDGTDETLIGSSGKAAGLLGAAWLLELHDRARHRGSFT